MKLSKSAELETKDLSVDRKSIILNNKTLSLAIEGKYTNLLIFSGRNDEKIYFRIDCYNQYWVPINYGISYLQNPNSKCGKIVKRLNDLYGFNKATLLDLPNILDLVKLFKVRERLMW